MLKPTAGKKQKSFHHHRSRAVTKLSCKFTNVSTRKNLRAIIHTEYGPPEVASMMEVAKPVPAKNEVLIKVHATTVNRTDCGFRSAEYFISRFFSGLFKPKFKTLGNEFAGVIEVIGKDVTSFNIGDNVFGYNDKNSEHMPNI